MGAAMTKDVALRVEFTTAPLAEIAGAEPHVVKVALPPLGGVAVEELFDGLELVGVSDGVALFRRGGLLVGHARAVFAEASVEADTRVLYGRVLAACGGKKLYRVWNYVPRINEHTGGLEHYRAFCKGRSLAFEAAFGAKFERQLSAASAVGSDGRTIEVIFAAGGAEPQHVENPEQVPAYRYPAEYGPRSPSFSRATVVEEGGQKWVFVSGTASIKGHATVGVGSLREQITATVDNLRLVSRASGLGGNLGASVGASQETGNGGTGWARSFKVYLRRAEDFAEARRALEGVLVFPERGDRVSWLRSDICRAELDIEIEATLRA